MEQGPGTPGTPTGPSGSPARPGLVTAAAVLLFIGGGLGALGGLLAVTGGGFVGGGLGGIAIVLGLVMLAVGALEIYAGVQVLALKEQGRMIGLVLAAIGALLSLLQLGAVPGSAIVGLAINGFVIYALVTTASAFHR
ncbi:MAG TPA: hypothetical protein VNO79_10860 [Actinomycetota bacterium]|nr:hypothetical protein [Actinomycetota bacterium]